jgi:hypothetical protein
MPDEHGSSSRGTVLLASPAPMVAVLLARELAKIAEVSEIFREPAALARAVRGGVGGVRRAGVIVDPDGDGWADTAAELRRLDSRLGLVVLTARPAYWVQRQWRQRSLDSSSDYLADALLSLRDDSLDTLRRVVQGAMDHPGESSRWLRSVPTHPHAYETSERDGPVARDLRGNEKLHRALVLEYLGHSRAEAARRVEWKHDTYTKALKKLKQDLGLDNDVALGAWATRAGLFDDVPKDP